MCSQMMHFGIVTTKDGVMYREIVGSSSPRLGRSHTGSLVYLDVSCASHKSLSRLNSNVRRFGTFVLDQGYRWTTTPSDTRVPLLRDRWEALTRCVTAVFVDQRNFGGFWNSPNSLIFLISALFTNITYARSATDRPLGYRHSTYT